MNNPNDKTQSDERTEGSLERVVGWWREIWKDLSGDNPMPRLTLAFLMASCIGSIGIMGILFGLLGALLMIGNPPADTVTWSKVESILDRSITRLVIGYGAAVVIHAVAKLYEKQNTPNEPS